MISNSLRTTISNLLLLPVKGAGFLLMVGLVLQALSASAQAHHLEDAYTEQTVPGHYNEAGDYITEHTYLKHYLRDVPDYYAEVIPDHFDSSGNFVPAYTIKRRY